MVSSEKGVFTTLVDTIRVQVLLDHSCVSLVSTVTLCTV